MRVSRRASGLKPSSTIAVTNKAKALRAEGVDVLSFAAGEPDFDTPERIKRAAIEALRDGQTKYAPTPGDPETRRVVAERFQRVNGIPDLTADHVVISTGGKQSLYLIFQSLLDPPGPDEEAPEVLLPTPAWVTYAPQAHLAGGRVVEVEAGPEDGFKITPERLREAISPRSRLMVFNSPSNPCGVTYTPEEVEALAKVVAEAAASTCPDLMVISDEIYDRLTYEGLEHRSFGSIPEVSERTVTINGMSKAYAMTGWRLGFAAGSGEFGLELARSMTKLQGQMTTCVASFTYPAIRVGLTECDDDVERMREAFAARARLISQRLSAIDGMVFPRPTGAFYVFADISAHLGKQSAGGRRIETAGDFAEALLEERHVAIVPGEDFLGCGPRCARISFACSEEQIEAGMERLGAFVSDLR